MIFPAFFSFLVQPILLFFFLFLCRSSLPFFWFFSSDFVVHKLIPEEIVHSAWCCCIFFKLTNFPHKSFGCNAVSYLFGMFYVEWMNKMWVCVCVCMDIDYNSIQLLEIVMVDLRLWHTVYAPPKSIIKCILCGT